MNSKVKWTQWIGAAVLATLVSVFFSGPVTAIPGIPLRVAVDVPPAGMDFSTRVRFEQYSEAIKQAERAYDTAETDPLNTTGKDSRARFDQYLAALALMDQMHNEAASATGLNSRVAFEQYLTALKQMEQDHIAAIIATGNADSRVRFEQYLKAIEQMENQAPFWAP